MAALDTTAGLINECKLIQKQQVQPRLCWARTEIIPEMLDWMAKANRKYVPKAFILLVRLIGLELFCFGYWRHFLGKQCTTRFCTLYYLFQKQTHHSTNTALSVLCFQSVTIHLISFHQYICADNETFKSAGADKGGQRQPQFEACRWSQKQNKHIHISYLLRKPGEGCMQKNKTKKLVINNVLKSIRQPVKNCRTTPVFSAVELSGHEVTVSFIG